MSDRTTGLIYIAALLLLSFVFQYQMKIFANEIAPTLSRAETGMMEKFGSLFRASIVWRMALVFSLAGLLFVFWLLALTKLELSVALPLASVALVLNAVGSGLLLGEGLTMLRIAGVMTVAGGIAMVLKS
jgi:multidrug transporter EmrE-like cation transporter